MNDQKKRHEAAVAASFPTMLQRLRQTNITIPGILSEAYRLPTRPEYDDLRAALSYLCGMPAGIEPPVARVEAAFTVWTLDTSGPRRSADPTHGEGVWTIGWVR